VPTSTDRVPLVRALIAVAVAGAGIALVVLGIFALDDGGRLFGSADASTAVESPAPSSEDDTISPSSLPQSTLAPLDHPVVDDPATGVPTNLWFPRLDISAPVTSIRVEGGVLEPPSNPRTVGWDVASARPGSARGSVVITGHTVHTGGGALDDLADLKVDDDVVVRTGKGKIAYSVSHVERVSKERMVSKIPSLFSLDVPGRLVLITCTDWDGHHYLSNTVVIADPEPVS